MKVFQFHIHYKTQYNQQLAVYYTINNEKIFETAYMQTFDWENWFLVLSLDEVKNNLDYKYIIAIDGNQRDKEWGKLRKIEVGSTNHFILHDSWRNRDNINNVFLSDAFTKAIFKRSVSKYYEPKIKDDNILRFRLSAGMVPPEYCIGITGSAPFLGEWKKPIQMSDAKFPYWELDIPTKAKDIYIEYKFVIMNPNSGEIIAWEEGENRILRATFSAVSKQMVIKSDNIYQTQERWRGSGLAIPVFSIRSQSGFGIGEFNDLKRIVDWGHMLGMDIIQVLPINDTLANMTWNDSYPYAAISIFALHPMYIHLPSIASFANEKDEKSFNALQRKLNALESIDFEQVLHGKMKYLRLLFDQEYHSFKNDNDAKNFIYENRLWLQPYAVFCHLRDIHKTANFNNWPDYSQYSEETIRPLLSETYARIKEVEFYYFLQYHADKQLKSARDHARTKGIALKGDLPIGIYRYSCDAWTAPKLFNMHEQAGAPPDDYAVLGQNWGFPTYNWQKMAEDGFAWWRQRMQALSKYFDALRIDHILGFFRIWQIPMHQIYGTLGLFNPRLPLTKEELAKFGIYGDLHRFTQPYITEELIYSTFGKDATHILKTFFEVNYQGISFKSAFKNQKDVDTFIKKNPKLQPYLDDILMMMSDVLLIEEPNTNGNLFNPRITLHTTNAYKALSPHLQHSFTTMYNDYYFKRHDGHWKQQALWKLPAILDASNMLICGEDLGMIPDSVPEVMRQLNILSLEIQRMPKGQNEFGKVKSYPYFSVSSPSCHDMSTIRGWWEADHEMAKKFYYNYMHASGLTPMECSTEIVSYVIKDHLDSPSMLAIFPIQDILGLEPNLRKKDAASEQINVPANVNHYWRFRLHIDTEKLLEAKEFNEKIKRTINSSGR
ncbi:MAG: 4-alpha-glucanotransferase [Saprospiraceae bacterium]